MPQKTKQKKKKSINGLPFHLKETLKKRQTLIKQKKGNNKEESKIQ
jgi:hypothetical protein